jgi:hypothetical protein
VTGGLRDRETSAAVDADADHVAGAWRRERGDREKPAVLELELKAKAVF